MCEKIIRATRDTTVILGAGGNPSGPNASVIAHGLSWFWPHVLSRKPYAIYTKGLAKDRQMEPLVATLFQHGGNPHRLMPAPPTISVDRVICPLP